MVALHDRRLAKILAGTNAGLCSALRNQVERKTMIQGSIHGLRQPEYVHVLLNPMPVYGLLISWIGLVAAVISKNRRAQIVTLILVFMTSISAWPVLEFGQQGYDRVLAMTDDYGHAWLDEHEARAEKFVYIFYAVAALSVAGIIVPLRWPKFSLPLALAVTLLGVVALASGFYIAYAGGEIRHRGFWNGTPPPLKTQSG